MSGLLQSTHDVQLLELCRVAQSTVIAYTVVTLMKRLNNWSAPLQCLELQIHYNFILTMQGLKFSGAVISHAKALVKCPVP